MNDIPVEIAYAKGTTKQRRVPLSAWDELPRSVHWTVERRYLDAYKVTMHRVSFYIVPANGRLVEAVTGWVEGRGKAYETTVFDVLEGAGIIPSWEGNVYQRPKISKYLDSLGVEHDGDVFDTVQGRNEA